MSYIISCYFLLLGLASAYLGILAIVQRPESNPTYKSLGYLKMRRVGAFRHWKNEAGHVVSDGGTEGGSWLVSLLLLVACLLAVMVSKVSFVNAAGGANEEVIVVSGE